MPKFLALLTHDLERSPRRGVLRALAVAGAGGLLGGRDAPPAAAKRKGKKGKKRGNKKCPVCPSTCDVVFTGLGGEKICGEGSEAPTPCTPCISHSQCIAEDTAYPYCVFDALLLASGETVPATCEGTPGMCVNVNACANFT